MRPITLLETVRKTLVKIITNCLFFIIAEHKVLQDNNFADISGDNTAIPIKVLNAILEDTRDSNKELWTILQDLSKAYDRVDLNFLKLAFKRIKLPPSLITFILNLFINRKNKVLITCGDTNLTKEKLSYRSFFVYTLTRYYVKLMN